MRTGCGAPGTECSGEAQVMPSNARTARQETGVDHCSASARADGEVRYGSGPGALGSPAASAQLAGAALWLRSKEKPLDCLKPAETDLGAADAAKACQG